MNDAGIAGGRNLAERAVGHRRIRVVELRVVKKIEEFRAIFQSIALAEVKGLVRRKIDVEGSRPDQRIAAYVAESVVGRRREGAGCEPLRELGRSGSTGLVRCGDELRLIVGIFGKTERVIAARLDIQREAALPRPDRRGFPAAEKGLRQTLFG